MCLRAPLGTRCGIPYGHHKTMYIAFAQGSLLGFTDTPGCSLEDDADDLGCLYLGLFGVFRQQSAVGEKEITDLQMVRLRCCPFTVHLISLADAGTKSTRRKFNGKPALLSVIVRADEFGSICRMHYIAIDTAGKSVWQILGLEAGRNPDSIGRDGGGICKLINRCRHLDDGESHAVGHGER